MRYFFLFFLIHFPAFAEPKKYSAKEVAKHSSAKDCWMVIQGKVYDLSSYIPKHPAPESALTDYCGKKADSGWETKGRNRPHSKAAGKLLPRFEVGELRPL